MSLPDSGRALRAAEHYRALGLVPLPSMETEKRPLPIIGRYGSFRTNGLPGDLYTPKFWPTTNLQLMTGTTTPGTLKVLVVDCDGQEARDTWKAICQHHGPPRKPWICESPSGGRHFYFAIPHDVQVVPSRLLWGIWDTWLKDWLKHKRIDLLGEGALSMAPPSIHPSFREEGRRYKWVPGYSPKDHPRPELAPDWLISMPGQDNRNRDPGLASDLLKTRKLEGQASDAELDDARRLRSALIDALGPHDKWSLAKSWGLRFTSNSPTWSHQGWSRCHAISRRDTNASASFNVLTGVYNDFGEHRTLSFFDLAVELQCYHSWFEACRLLAIEFGLSHQ